LQIVSRELLKRIIGIALLTIALTSGADVSMPAFEPQEDILNIHNDIN